MTSESLQLTVVLPAAPRRIYDAWLDSAEHAAFTGGAATLDPTVGGPYAAWDGYIRGVTLELEPGGRIVQSWRTDEFPADAPDSRLELQLVPDAGGTLLTLTHTEIPEGLAHRYEEGWIANYFEPMRTYFRGEGPRTEDALTVALPRAVPARKKRKAAKAPARKAARKAPRPASKVARKPRPAAKRTPPGKAAPRGGARKPAGRTARKVTARPVRKTARKPVRRRKK